VRGVSGFRGFLPYDEGAGEAFHGRADEVARLMRLLAGEARVVVLSGPSGVGKTSLLRAGLIPALSRRGAQVVMIGAYEDLDGEIVRGASRLGSTPPLPHQSSADYLARIARDSQNGLVLIFDHLEEALSDEVGRGADVGALLARVLDQGGSRMRVLLSVDEAFFARLDQLRDAGASAALASSAWMTLPGLAQEQVSEVLERTAIQSGTFFESGLAGAVAADLCSAGRCRPLDLQMVARAIVDLRLSSVRKYQRSGGAAVLPALLLERVCEESGGRVARQALLAAAERGEITADDLDARTPKARDAAAAALVALKGRGLLRARTRGRREAFALAHPGLVPAVESFAIDDRARAAEARRSLRRRLTAGERLRLPELWAVHRHLGGALAPDEQVTFMRSARRAALQAGVGAALVIAIFVALVSSMRRSYTLGFEPRDGGGAARVVVRLGRDSFLSFLSTFPNHPRFGSVIADTGFAAAGLGADTAARITAGKATGTLDASAAARGAVPAWLREVVNGLRPVPRGVAKALIGDPDGVTALKQAFSDPLARRETLEALAVIGRGGAGEDEILAAALADSAPEIRRRGVEVAASIDRRQGNGAHGATLRSALGDKSADVRGAVLRETATLPAAEAAGILAVALRDPDPTFRKSAEAATTALAARAPGAAASALEPVLQSPDGGVRRAGLALLETIAASDPAACAAPLRKVVADDKAPEEARVEALFILRRAGTPAADLRPLLEQAVRPEASPRLRAAALPLYARLVTPEQAEEIARTEMKGSPAARAAGAAVWGTVAMSRPDLAAKPLKSLLYDPAAETRVEAARSFAYLKRDGLELVDKALKDGSAEVERAAIDSAVALAPINPYQVAEMLGHATKFVRASVRKSIVEALAKIGETKPAAVVPPLAHALKDQDVGMRAAAANAFCALAQKNAAAASPYLRVAARDDRDEVRTAAAACLGELSEADPKGAARIAAELGDAPQAGVRVAAAEALGRLGAKARDLTVPALLKLVTDPERSVRVAAERSLGVVAEKSAGQQADADAGATFFTGKRATDVERALGTALTLGDAHERRNVVGAAAKAGLVGVLRQASADGDESVRLEAVRAAGALGGGALEVVRGAVDDRANGVRAEATRILAGVSGAGAREVLPIFESMLRGGDKAAREAAVIGVGDLVGAGEAGARLLGEALSQRSEALRTAAARALGHLAEREPEVAQPYLERAVRDPSYDVRNAAMPGLALAWARRQPAPELGRALNEAEADSTRRFVALEALVLKAQGPRPGASAKGAPAPSPAEREAARQTLQMAGDHGPPLARLAAQIGRAFLEAQPPDLHAFIERLLGG
jgi:HEAT repeat protein